MSDFSLTGALHNLKIDLDRQLAFSESNQFDDLWDERFLRLAHAEKPDQLGHLEFSPDAPGFGPFDAIWQLYMLTILSDPDIGLRNLIKDPKIAKRADQAIAFIRRWWEGDPPLESEWDQLVDFTPEEMLDDKPFEPAEQSVVSLILAAGGLIIETESIVTYAAIAYRGRALPQWARTPLKRGGSRPGGGLFSAVIRLIKKSKANPVHITCQARVILKLAQLRWTPIDAQEEALFYRLLSGEESNFAEYERRLKEAFVEPDEIAEMLDTIHWANSLLSQAGVRRFAHVAGDDGPVLAADGIMPMAFRTWVGVGRQSIQISWVDTKFRWDRDLPDGLQEQMDGWLGEKPDRQAAAAAWSKLRKWARQQGYRESDRSLSRRVLQKPASDGRTEFWIIDCSTKHINTRFGFLPAKPDPDFWYRWETVERRQERAFPSAEEGLAWCQLQVAEKLQDGFVEVFPRPTYFSQPVDLDAIRQRTIPDPGLHSDTFIEADSKAGQWIRKFSRPSFEIVYKEGEGEPQGSRVFGSGWLPAGEKWPNCPTCAKPMTLLAQLNLHSLTEQTHTPQGSGIVQWFECLQDSDDCDAARKELGAPCRLVRTISADGQGSLVAPPEEGEHQPRAIERCKDPKDDFPHGQDYKVLGYKEDIGFVWHEYDRAYDVLARQHPVVDQDKIGGWPDWPSSNYDPRPQCPQCGQPLALLLQLTSIGPLGDSTSVEGAFLFQCPEHKQSLAAACRRYRD